MADAVERGLDSPLAAGIGEPHEPAAIDPVEIDARRGGDAGRRQQILAEAQRVIGETRDVAIGVEGAVDRSLAWGKRFLDRREHQLGLA